MLGRRETVLGLACLTVLLLAAQERGVRPFPPDQGGKEKRLALVVGIDRYPEGSGFPQLQFAHRDALDLSRVLAAQGYDVTTLQNEDTRGHAIQVELETLLQKASNGASTIIFAFSGHGAQQNGIQYLATWDATRSLLSKGTGLELNHIRSMLQESTAARKVMFIDACRSDPSVRGEGSPIEPFTELEKSSGIRILSATAPGSSSYEDPALRNGVFSHYLWKGLGGEARNADSVVTFNSLFAYVRRQMAAYEKQNTTHHQSPYEASQDVTGDFLLTGPFGGATRVHPPGERWIELFAGSDWIFDGDGKPAIDAPLGSVQGVGVDEKGNVLFSDVKNGIVCRIDSKGLLEVLAGSTGGLPPIPGVAKGTPLNGVHQVAADGQGNVYFAVASQVLKLGKDGSIVAVAGTGTAGKSGDGASARKAQIRFVHGIALAPDGTLYIADFGNNNIRKVDRSFLPAISTIGGDGRAAYAGDNGPAERASFRIPTGIATDGKGNVYIADQGNGRIRKIDTQGTVTTVGPAAGCPTGVAADPTGAVYYADPCGRSIRKIDTTGRVSVIAGKGRSMEEPAGAGGRALDAYFDEWQIALDQAGNLYVAGTDSGRVYRIAKDGIFSILAGNGRYNWTPDGAPARELYLSQPIGMTVDRSGDLIVADANNHRILRIAPNGASKVIAGVGGGRAFGGYNGDGIPATKAWLNYPSRVRVDGRGNIYFTELQNHRVRKIDTKGTISTVAGNGVPGYGGDGGTATSAMLHGPAGLCLDDEGNLYIADGDNHRIRKVTPGGIITTVAGTGEAGYGARSGSGTQDGGPALGAALNHPSSIEMDRLGNLYIADDLNNRIRKVFRNGVIQTIAGDGNPRFAGDHGPAVKASLWSPRDLWLAPDQSVYIADTLNQRIRRIDPAGIITTVAGGGAGYAGDGGPALAAGLTRNTRGITGDAAGNLYISDFEKHRIRVIHHQ
jgi:sugar lactone lactonase YvrE